MPDFYRIKRLPPYVFEQVNRIKAAARANGADIIDLGMGNPDLQAPQHVIDKLAVVAFQEKSIQENRPHVRLRFQQDLVHAQGPFDARVDWAISSLALSGRSIAKAAAENMACRLTSRE